MEQTKTKNYYQVSIRGLDILLQEISLNESAVSNKISNLSDWLHNLGFTDIQIGEMITAQEDLILQLSLTPEQYNSFLFANCNLTQFPFCCIQSYMNEVDKQDDPITYDIQSIYDINALECVKICIL